jgi:beta-lactamase regulating signal transducer with metallopeptidase domain
MSVEAVHVLVRVTLASSAALLLVFSLRRPLRALAGARAAYALWLLAPALVIAVLLPAPSHQVLARTFALPGQFGAAFYADVGVRTPDRIDASTMLFAIWLLGFAAMACAVVRRQRRFSRSLGPLVPDPGGLYRSAALEVPLLIGLWKPKIVVPANFEDRYTPEERELVLEHERIHARRGDVAVNALATLWLCVSWFNPLVYRALGWLRRDQELACDALVVARRRHSRRSYAAALLRTQLAADAAWRAPIGCRWQSTHPLTERITMLKQSPPGLARRVGGFALITVLTGAASFTAWAAKPAAGDAPILIDMKITITNPQTNEVNNLATRYLVHSGEEARDATGHPLDFACTPWLPDDVENATIASNLKTHHIVMRPGQVLLECALRRNGEVTDTPVVLVGDGTWGTVELTEHGGPRQFRIEVRPSTSAADIAAATQASEGRTP